MTVQPPPPPPPVTTTPKPLLRRDQLVAAAGRAGAGYVALVGLGLVAAVVALGASWGSSGDGLPASAILSAPFVLASTALFSPLGMTASDDVGGASISVTVVPLTLTLLGALAIWAWSLRRPARPTSVQEAWLTSLATGAVLGVGAAVLAAVFRVTLGEDETRYSIHANPFLTLVGGLVVGTLAAAVGAATARDGRRLHVDLRALGITVPPVLGRAARAAGLGFGGALVVASVGIAIWVAVESDVVTGLLSLGLLGVNLGAAGLGLGGLGALEVSGGALFDDTTAQNVSLFSDGSPGALWLLLLATVIGTVVTAARLARSVGGWQDAWATPAVLAVAALATSLLGGARVAVHVEAFIAVSSTGRVALAAWVFLVAALWGALVEVLARTVAPALVAQAAELLPTRPAPTTLTTPTTPTPQGPGAPAPSAPTAYAADPVPARPLVSRRAAVAIVAGLGGLVVVVVGGTVARNVVNSSQHGPDRPVVAYLDALSDGKPSKAFAVADPDLAVADRALLTDAVYGKVANRPTAIHVRDVHVEGGTATVAVTYDVGGTKTTQSFTLHKDGHESVLFDRWVLDAPSVAKVPLQVRGTGDEATVAVVVNGQSLDLDAASPTLALLPGAWSVTLPDIGPYEESPTLSYLVVDDDGSDARASGDGSHDALEYTLTDAALREAERQTQALVATCVTSSDPRPDGCPLYAPVYDTLQSGSWQVAEQPTVVATRSTWSNGSIDVEVSGGEATFAYTPAPSLFDDDPKPQKSPGEFRGHYPFVVADGKVVLEDQD